LPDSGRGPWDGRALRLAVYLAGTLLLLRWQPRLGPLLLFLWAVVGPLLAAVALWEASGGGAPLGRDDHASFLHRLWLYDAVRPWPVLYDPWWNGGRVTNALGASGSALPGLWAWPFTVLAGGSVERAYTPALAAYFLLAVPGLGYAGVRLLGGNRRAGAIAGLLALGVHWDHFKYLLHFGTLGSSYAAPFFMVLPGLLQRAAGDCRRWGLWAALGLAVWAALAWPVHAVPLGLLLPGWLLALRWRDRALYPPLGGTGLALLLWFLPLVLVMLRLTDVVGFVQKGVVVDRPAFTLGQGWAHLREVAFGAHPLLLCGGLAALGRPPAGVSAKMLVPALAGVPLVILCGGWFSPSLEWHRLAIAWCYLAVPVTALRLAHFFPVQAPTQWRSAAGAAGVCALLLLTLLNVQRFCQGRSPAPFHPVREEVYALAARIREAVPPERRVLFAGFTGHRFGGGHVALLPMLTGREMLAADYYHFSPKLVEYFMPPREYRTSPEATRRFLTLFNVGLVVVSHAEVRRFYEGHPEWFEPVGGVDSPLPKWLFRVREAGTLFVENAGSVQPLPNRLRVTLEDPSRPAVIRYRWSPLLRVDPPARLAEAPQDEHTSFLRLDPGGQGEVEIYYPGWP
jgi:hypothetical protein